MTDLEIRANDSSGTFNAYAALPATGNGPGILVIQEIYAVNGFIRSVCDYYASLGFLAVAPDLFWRLEPGLQLNPADEADHNKAFALLKQMDMDKTVADLVATMNAMRSHEACTGKVGTVGFCLGGRLAYLMATRTDADANVGYYGVGIENLLQEAKGITRPLMLHIAEDDSYVPAAAQAKIEQELAGLPGVKLFRYPGANHGFARTGGQNYKEDAARLALERTVTMLSSALEQ